MIRGKHKRGDRGSTEEEFTTSKRANMADELNSSEDNPTLDDENLEATDEPTRAELKEMLVDIQISIQSILRENKETRREVVQLKDGNSLRTKDNNSFVENYGSRSRKAMCKK